MRITIETNENKGIDKILPQNDNNVNQDAQDAGAAIELVTNQDVVTDLNVKAYDTANAINGGPPDQTLITSIESARSSDRLFKQEQISIESTDGGKAPE